jgi:hypothetical protein
MLHADKKNTPTMGGAFLVPACNARGRGGCVVLTLLGADPWRVWAASGWLRSVLAAHAALGLYDDYCKLTKRGKDGLSGRKKLVAQTLIAALACTGAYLLWLTRARGLCCPLRRPISAVLMIPARRVRDGRREQRLQPDRRPGRAGRRHGRDRVLRPGRRRCAGVFGSGDPCWPGPRRVLGMAAAGALVGFLYWNRHPARVFMGDTGSLSLGALLGFHGGAGRLELVLAVAGGVFVAEAGSPSCCKWRTSRRPGASASFGARPCIITFSLAAGTKRESRESSGRPAWPAPRSRWRCCRSPSSPRPGSREFRLRRRHPRPPATRSYSVEITAASAAECTEMWAPSGSSR